MNKASLNVEQVLSGVKRGTPVWIIDSEDHFLGQFVANSDHQEASEYQAREVVFITFEETVGDYPIVFTICVKAEDAATTEPQEHPALCA